MWRVIEQSSRLAMLYAASHPAWRKCSARAGLFRNAMKRRATSGAAVKVETAAEYTLTT